MTTEPRITFTLPEATLHVILDALTAHTNRIEHHADKPWQGYDDDTEPPYALGTEDGYGEALDDAKTLVGDALGAGPTPPRVEILAYRDPDGGTDIDVWADGKPAGATIEIVDPGRGWDRADWRKRTAEVATANYSPDFRDAVIDARKDAEDSEYIIHEHADHIVLSELVSGDYLADLARDLAGDFPAQARIWRPSSDTPGAPAYPERTGWPVTILRPLTPAEAETDETGPMYRVRFADGTETDAFADELTREDG